MESKQLRLVQHYTYTLDFIHRFYLYVNYYAVVESCFKSPETVCVLIENISLLTFLGAQSNFISIFMTTVLLCYWSGTRINIYLSYFNTSILFYNTVVSYDH